MAPAPSSTADQSSTPLADYFFISGIESSQVYDERTQNNSIVTSPLAQPPVDETIEEDRALETDSIRPTSQDGLSNADTTRRRSANRFSENRQSNGTIVGIGSDSKQTASNRSSATIKGLQLGGSGLSDQEFDIALRKFASERDTAPPPQGRVPDHSACHKPTMTTALEISGPVLEASVAVSPPCRAA
jgi:hypothetical protein